MEEITEPKKEWKLGRAIKNTFTWDKTDWEYTKNHIIWLLIILLLSYLYYTETKACHETLSHLDRTCLFYVESLKGVVYNQSGIFNYTEFLYNLKNNITTNLTNTIDVTGDVGDEFSQH
jgi:lipopolysaccharide export system protein LptC